MSMFILSIKTENADFREDDGEIKNCSIARILRDVTTCILKGDLEGHIMDINGNKVGYYAHSESRAERRSQ